jgi:hypothetical protein
LIGSYLIRNEYQLIKLIPGKKQVVSARDAFDNKYVIPENVKDGILPNVSRFRPYYSRPYKDMFCENDPHCDLECQKCYDLLLEAKEACDYWKDSDIGFACGKPNSIVVIDNDTGMNLEEFKSYITKTYGPLPNTWLAKTKRGHHFYYWYDGDLPSDISKFVSKVDILSTGRWVVLPPFNNYSWINPPRGEPTSLPAWVKNLRFAKMPEPYFKPRKFTNSPIEERNQVATALGRLPIESVDGQTWAKVGYALCSNGYESEFRDWCHSDSRPKKMFKEAQIKSFRNPQTITSIGVFFKIAKQFS